MRIQSHLTKDNIDMDNKFYSNKSSSFGRFLIASSLFIIAVAFGLPLLIGDNYPFSSFIITCLVVVPVSGLFLWAWMATYYLIENEILIAKSGPFLWRVPIKEISLIRLNQETFGGTWKLTLSWKCMEIKYRRVRSIFISPANENEFLDRLLKINPKIDIKQK